MKYLNIIYIKYNDDKDEKKAMYDTDNELSCVANHHSLLGSYLNADAVASVMCLAMSEEGNILAKDYFVKSSEVANG